MPTDHQSPWAYSLCTVLFLHCRPVGNFHCSSGELHQPLVLEITQHPGHYLPWITQMTPDGLVGDLQDIRSLQCTFFQQEACQPLVKALPQNLLQQLHDIGKSACHDFICKICQRCGLIHDRFITICGYDPKFSVHFRFNHHLKLNGTHHAGGREQADISL